MRFVCDQMFGTLANWLRLLGFDTFYTAEEISDDELLQVASAENRTLITRDKQLVFSARKLQVPVIYIDSKDLNEQLKRVLKESNAQIADEKTLTRCSVCNGILKAVKKQSVEGKVPENVYLYQQQFWQCLQCHKIYWKGSHFQKIKSKINQLKTELYDE